MLCSTAEGKSLRGPPHALGRPSGCGCVIRLGSGLRGARSNTRVPALSYNHTSDEREGGETSMRGVLVATVL
jgi:hypothetical protein